MLVTAELSITRDAAIATWFGVGGRADRLARPTSVEQLAAALELDPDLRVLGDGANLLVADEGVRELVVVLAGPLAEWTIGPVDAEGWCTVTAGAGANLPKLINDTVRQGLEGLETLGGIPASVGGAVIMNAGGKFGATADRLSRVRGLARRSRRAVTLERAEMEFAYRHSSLAGAELVITHAEFRLRRAPDPAAVRARLLEVMAYKKTTQPMAERSAGCCFKNPTLAADIAGVGTAGARVSAGQLIDLAGCKGLSIGGATVSDRHANFFIAGPGCSASDLIALIRAVRARVQAAFNVTLEPEVVVWGARV